MGKHTVKLTEENFTKQITELGFFPEQVPECFNSKLLSRFVKDLIKEIGDGRGTSPVTISIYKDELSRRILSIPNPEDFLRLVELMQNNWTKIKELAYSKNSLSPITTIKSYEDVEKELLNGEAVRNRFLLKSDFVKNKEECIRAALGYRYKLTVDISNFYNSIYTHSVAWAICGKIEAKKMHKKQEPKSPEYELSDKLDKHIRFQKNNETSGIIVGPYTSRIFSEVILAGIDKALLGKNLVFKRYVDDFSMYFRTESEARQSLNVIEKVLNEYNLNLNQSKTKIESFPYDTISDISKKYKDIFSKKDTNGSRAFEVLNKAGELYKSGEKGAYKYALKFLRSHPIDLEKFDLILPLLINIMLLDPKNGNYVLQYIKKYINKIDTIAIENIINEELKISLKNELQQETLLFLSFIKELNLKLEGENLIEILKTREDLSLIISLDIWRNANENVNATSSERTNIETLIKELFEDLKNESYKGEHWLLLYESQQHKLNPNNKYVYAESESKFFKKMNELGISFYSSVKK